MIMGLFPAAVCMTVFAHGRTLQSFYGVEALQRHIEAWVNLMQSLYMYGGSGHAWSAADNKRALQNSRSGADDQ